MDSFCSLCLDFLIKNFNKRIGCYFLGMGGGKGRGGSPEAHGRQNGGMIQSGQQTRGSRPRLPPNNDGHRPQPHSQHSLKGLINWKIKKNEIEMFNKLIFEDF